MLQVFLLGTPRIILDGSPVHGLTSTKSQALLYYLAMTGKPAPRLTLAGLLWPNKGDKTARTNLRQAIHHLRPLLGDASAGGYLAAARESIALQPARPLEVDAAAFKRTAQAGLEGDVQALELAASLYTGEFMSGFYVDNAPGYEEWVLMTRERLRSLIIQSLHQLALRCTENGQVTAGLKAARRLLEIEPWRESAHLLAMQFLAWDGQRGAALAQFEHCRKMLAEELGVEPESETLALYQAIRSNQVHRQAPAPPQPEHAPRPARRASNLPSQATPFIGRARELAEVRRLLTPSAPGAGRPMVTLFGAGGSGKTRLALQTSAGLQACFPGGVWFIELASVTDPGHIPHAIVAALELQEGVKRTPLDVLCDYFGQQESLLILDNCEQVAAGCAETARLLRQHCPGLTILATSREALQITGESVYSVPPMSLPDPEHPPTLEDIQQCDSLRLFVERAQAAWPAFPVTPAGLPVMAEICRRLDGMPLAIELAAARAGALSLEQLAQRLDQRFRLLTRGSRSAPARHQTLRAMVDWSYDLLDGSERALLQRLSVFSDGWTLAAAEAVCAAGPGGPAYALEIHPLDVLDLLSRLADKSLVQIREVQGEHSRYQLLETIRQYGLEKLHAAGDEPAARENHARFFLQLAATANARLRGPEQKEWTTRLRAEQDNLHAAQTWWLEAAPGQAVQMAGLLGRYWDRQGLYSEGREMLSRALAAPGDVPAAYRLEALKWAGGLAMRQSNFEQASALVEQGLALARAEAQRAAEASFLNILCLIAAGQGRDLDSRGYAEASVRVFREIGDTAGLIISLRNLANIIRATGGLQTAQAYLQECIVAARAQGDQHQIASNLVGLAECHIEAGQLEAALPALQEALEIQAELGDQQGQAYTTSNLGIVAWQQADYARAQAWHEKSLAIRQAIGDRNGEGYLLYLLGITAAARQDYSAARCLAGRGLEILHALGDERNSIHCLEALGHALLGQGCPTRAVGLWAAAHAWRERMGTPMRLFFHGYHQARQAEARASLGEAAFGLAWEAGWALTYEQAVAAARQEEAGAG